MTDWEDAPVLLAGRNFVRKIGGRRYELYYNGPRLHMVVLKTDGASYWVVNTLLDRLSNETMIAIAKGLRPLAKVSRSATYPAAAMSESAQRSPSSARGTSGSSRARASPSSGTASTIRDVIPERIDALRRGEVPIYEPGLGELLERNAERLGFTTDVGEAIDGAEFVYVAVGTPPTYSGDADLSAVWTVVDELPDVGGGWSS